MSRLIVTVKPLLTKLFGHSQTSLNKTFWSEKILDIEKKFDHFSSIVFPDKARNTLQWQEYVDRLDSSTTNNYPKVVVYLEPRQTSKYRRGS